MPRQQLSVLHIILLIIFKVKNNLGSIYVDNGLKLSFGRKITLIGGVLSKTIIYIKNTL